MTPIVHCSAGNIHFFPRTTFSRGKDIRLTKQHISGNFARLTLSSKKFLLSDTSVRPFHLYRSNCLSNHRPRIQSITAVGTDVTVEEPSFGVSEENADKPSEVPPGSVETSESAPTDSVDPITATSGSTKPVEKSEMPPVRNEDLIPGASFTGKVKSIQPFGAFVDFGAFTVGLVHISRLKSGFVKDVGEVVSVGQEVKVRIVQANVETGRISLTMRDNDAPSLKGKESRSGRTSEMPPVKNEDLIPGASFTGKVRSIQPFGAFVDFGAFSDGLVHVSRMGDGFVKDVGDVVSVGQEVKVWIVDVNFETGRIRLTMRDGDHVNTQQRKESPARRRSEMPPVNDEDLIPGATFTGKVVAVQPFGAFVDFGAFTDGLVHVSRMSDEFVEDAGDLVSVGQEVKVRVVKADMETKKISLTMRDGDDSKRQQGRESRQGREGPAAEYAARSNQEQKTSKFEVGQILDGTVKNLTRAGALVSLPDGEEGFLPLSEESEGFRVIGNPSSLTIGQEVKVRVLRFSKGGVTVTMKTKADVVQQLVDLKEWEMATNPFESAFRKNKAISAYLEEQEKIQKASESIGLPETSEQIENKVDDTITKSGNPTLDISTTTEEIQEETTILIGSVSSEPASDNKDPTNILPQSVSSVSDTLAEDNDSSSTLTVSSLDARVDKVLVPDDLTDSIAAVDTVEEEVSSSEALISEESESSASLETGESSITNEGMEAGTNTKLVEENEEELTSEAPIIAEVPVTDEAQENDVVIETVLEDESSSKILDNQENGETIGLVRDEGSAGDISDQSLPLEVGSPEENNSTIADDTLIDEKVGNELAPAYSEDVKLESSEASNEQTSIPDKESADEATISPTLVKQLRDESGAGMMDCKQALLETEGDIVKAQEFLRKKGLASADKKASRATAEGRIGSYIHDSRIGVLIEVNCETDFVSRGEIFKQLVDDLAMQVAACPQVRYLTTEDVSEEIVSKEREIEMQKEDLLSKPEQFRSKIVDGRIRKRLEELALLEQPYIKNDKMVVKDWVKHTIATVGENIRVKRFVRYNLGEGLEKKSQDFAAEVAAQTAAKESPLVPKDEPAEAETATVEKPAVAVAAALVKQLREETGAGMMDCKKALTETGGDLEKAQEYLRKKGLSSADKKSSRLATEGRISSYIHDARIGVLIEVNSETDFVGRNEKFKELVEDLAMQVAACPQVEFVSIEDIPESIVNKEKEIEMQREDLMSKPEDIREKIVQGRISKRLGELALLEQPFIKDDSLMVKDLVKQTVAALGENIRVRRFVRLTLGESTD